MKIFFASSPSPNPEFRSNLWYDNLRRPLADMGHDVVDFDFDLYETFRNVDIEDPVQRAFVDVNRPRVTKELLRQIRAAHAEKPIRLFFSYFYDACIEPEAIDQIREMGITTVNWYCNASYQLHLVSRIAPHYDWCLVPEKFRLNDYEALGARPIYSQEAANPNVYHPYDVEPEFDVTFVGQAYEDRPELIRHLLDAGIDVRVWGYGWDRLAEPRPEPRSARLQRTLTHAARRLMTADGWRSLARRVTRMHVASPPADLSDGLVHLPATAVGGTLTDEELVRMYSRSKINLGFSTCWSTSGSGRIVQIRLRDFEVPMSGGFYMVEYMEELEEFFEIGKEIVCYRDKDDLLNKIRYYLAHDDEREAIRLAGMQRALRDHTWHKRFTEAFRVMELR